MLTAEVRGSRRPRRAASVAEAAPPTWRVTPRAAALATVLLGTPPTVVALARSRPVTFGALSVLALALGAALGWAAEDPAAEVLAPMPVSTPVRTVLRIVGVSTVTAPVAIGDLLLASAGQRSLPEDWLDLAPLLGASAALALAGGLVAARRGERIVGPIGVATGLGGILVVAALAYRWPDVLPSLAPGPHHDRWWAIAAVAAVVAVHAGRDPANR